MNTPALLPARAAKSVRHHPFLLAAVLCCRVLFVVAAGIPASMATRCGLSNEQLDALVQRFPDATIRITPQDWRAMRYECFRFANVTSWIDSVAASNGVAAAMLKLQDAAEHSAAAQRAAEALARSAEAALRVSEAAHADAVKARDALESLYSAATNAAAVAEHRAQAAERRAARLVTLREWFVEQRDKALLPTTKAIYQALIDKIDEKEFDT